MPSRRDCEFIRVAIQKGYLDGEKGREVLLRLRQAEKNQAQLSLDRLVEMEELLDAAQIRELQAATRRKLIYCLCGQKTNIFDFDPGTRVRCKKCGRVIPIPE
ncbi:MAG: hypothetical protein ACYS47_04730 [Planctomycetota bacterium]|jgi:hypothetical protein